MREYGEKKIKSSTHTLTHTQTHSSIEKCTCILSNGFAATSPTHVRRAKVARAAFFETAKVVRPAHTPNSRSFQSLRAVDARF